MPLFLMFSKQIFEWLKILEYWIYIIIYNLLLWGINVIKFLYKGSGRVTFNNTKSYMRAVAAAFIEIKTQKFNKKVQVDPYLEDALCSTCKLKQVLFLVVQLKKVQWDPFKHRCYRYEKGYVIPNQSYGSRHFWTLTNMKS